MTRVNEYPTVSVVIPAKNERDYMGKCLDSLLQQTYPVEHMEILVVDGSSTDGTREIIKDYSQKYPVKLLDNPSGFTPTGMNIGLEAARGEIGIIFSAHATADKDFILKNVETLKSSEAACVGGKLVNRSQGAFAQLAGKVLGHPFGVGNSKFRYSDKADYVDTVAYGAYSMPVLKQVGFFDERLIRNQDIELNYRLRHKGFKIFFDPEIISYYHPRETYDRFVKQAYANGYWNIITAKLCAQSLSWRHFIPFVFVLGVLGGIALSVIFHTLIFFGLAVGPYLILDIIVSSRISTGLGEFFQLVWLFPSLHFSYGVGSLVALVKQIVSRGK